MNQKLKLLRYDFLLSFIYFVKIKAKSSMNFTLNFTPKDVKNYLFDLPIEL